MNRIRKNDTVLVVSGKDRGKQGRVVNVYPKADKVMVEGVNIATKHSPIRYNNRGGQEGGREHVEMPIHISNVMPICPKCGEATRVGAKYIDGEKYRICRKCGSEFS